MWEGTAETHVCVELSPPLANVTVIRGRSMRVPQLIAGRTSEQGDSDGFRVDPKLS